MREFNRLAIALLVLGATGCGGGGGGGGGGDALAPAATADAFVASTGVVIDSANPDTADPQDISAITVTADDTTDPAPVTGI